MNIVVPQKLYLGDTVGIISPSGYIGPEQLPQFEKGVRTLEELNLKVKVSKHVFDRDHYSAGSVDSRISDLHAMWADEEVKMILMSQGGRSALQLLDKIDYGLIKSKPKIFAGISDGTILLNAIFARAGLVTFHGTDLIWGLGRELSQPFKENFYQTFFEGTVPPFSPNRNWRRFGPPVEYQGWRWLRPGKAEGILIGGHLGCLSSLLVAGYAPDFDKRILFLEGTEDVSQIDRYLNALRLSGSLGLLSGLIVGWFDGWNRDHGPESRSIADLVLEVTEGLDIPILEMWEFGHNVENFILPVGGNAKLDSFTGYFSLLGRTVG